MRPATLLHAIAREIKGIPDWAYVSVICRRRGVGVRVLGQKRRIFRPWIARRMIAFSLSRVLALLRACRHASKRRDREGGRAGSQKTPSRSILYQLTLVFIVNH